MELLLSTYVFPLYHCQDSYRIWLNIWVKWRVSFVCTFVLFFGHCVVCSSSIYGLWLPLRYLQTLCMPSRNSFFLCFLFVCFVCLRPVSCVLLYWLFFSMFHYWLPRRILKRLIIISTRIILFKINISRKGEAWVHEINLTYQHFIETPVIKNRTEAVMYNYAC